MATLILRPNAVGDENAITYQYPESGSHWDKVDEAVADEIDTNIWTVSQAYQRDLYNLPAHTTEHGAINSVKIYVRCKTTGNPTTGSGKIAIKSNSVAIDGGEFAIQPTPFQNFSQQWNTNPSNSQVWSWADIDSLQIGLSILNVIGTETYCTQV